MRIHRTTSKEVWKRVTIARSALRNRPRSQLHGHGWNRFFARARAYFVKMKGMPSRAGEIYPVEIAWSFAGSLIGMGLLTWCNAVFFERTDNLLLMGTFGASAMLLFGAPQVPFAQPRNVVGGHVVSSLVGITAYFLFQGMPHLAPAFGVAGAIAAMHATGTLHPPGGGTALLMATGDPSVVEFGYFAVIFPVGTALSILVAVALVINNLARDRRYPVSWW